MYHIKYKTNLIGGYNTKVKSGNYNVLVCIGGGYA